MFGLDLLLTASVSFVITFLAIPVIINIADQKKLFDLPDERKIHPKPIASLGGVAIFAGFTLSALLSIQGKLSPEFQYFFAAALVIFFLGLKDDLVILSPIKKFVGQLIAASILIHLGKFRIDSLHGLFGVEKVPEAFSLAITYLTIVVVINSFNLIDGVDGLAGSLGTVSMVVFGIYFFLINQQPYSLLAFAMAGSLVAFLIFNHQPAKIFMGDSGSLMIGLVSSILVIRFINVADTNVVPVKIISCVAVAISILIVPLLDTLRVFGFRIINGKSPFTPDRNHFHHLLLDKGFSHASITFICVSLNVFFILLAYFGRFMGPNYLLLIILSISAAGIGILYRGKNRRHMVIAKGMNGNGELKTEKPRIFTLPEESEMIENN